MLLELGYDKEGNPDNYILCPDRNESHLTIMNTLSKSFSFYNISNIASFVSIDIKNLFPDTQYYIYCLTEDFYGHSMTIDNILNSRVISKTRCCKSIQIQSFYNQVPIYIIGTSLPTFIITLKVSLI